MRGQAVHEQAVWLCVTHQFGVDLIGAQLVVTAFARGLAVVHGNPRIRHDQIGVGDSADVDGVVAAQAEFVAVPAERHVAVVAAAVERQSDHPLAAAVVDHARDRFGAEDLPDVTAVETITGRGITATMDGETVHIGKAVLFDEKGNLRLPGPSLPDALRTTIERLEREPTDSAGNPIW